MVRTGRCHFAPHGWSRSARPRSIDRPGPVGQRVRRDCRHGQALSGYASFALRCATSNVSAAGGNYSGAESGPRASWRATVRRWVTSGSSVRLTPRFSRHGSLGCTTWPQGRCVRRLHGLTLRDGSTVPRFKATGLALQARRERPGPSGGGHRHARGHGYQGQAHGQRRALAPRIPNGDAVSARCTAAREPRVPTASTPVRQGWLRCRASNASFGVAAGAAWDPLPGEPGRGS